MVRETRGPDFKRYTNYEMIYAHRKSESRSKTYF